MKKILFVVENLSGGGAEKVLLTLVKNLDKYKYDVTVYTIVETGVYVDEFKKYCKVKYALKDYSSYSLLGKLYYRIKMKLIYALKTSLVYKWLIKDKYDIEVAFVEGFDTKFVSNSFNKKSKKIAWVHTNMNTNNYADNYHKNLDEHKLCYKKFDKILAVSEDVKKQFIEKFSIENVKVQYNPVDEQEILSLADEYLEFDKDKLTMITVGRLTHQKGYDRLLRIVNKLKDEGYNFHILILGEGELRNKFEEYIYNNDLDKYVTLLGFKSNPYKYMKNSDLFVCSSYTEGFSTVATEALLLDIPIFTTNCSGMNELFGNQQCGIITENNEDSLYDALKKVLDNQELLEFYSTEIKERKQFFKLKQRMSEIDHEFSS